MNDSWLLMTHSKQYLLTDARYFQEARACLRGVRIVLCQKGLAAKAVELLKNAQIGNCGFDGHSVSCALIKSLRFLSPKGFRWKSANDLVEKARAIKDRTEIERIKGAVRLNLEAFSYLARILKPKMKEADIAQFLEKFVRARGARFSFSPIVASGPHSSYPHARVTDRKIRLNEPVLVDMGIEFKGYKSDLTRMFFLGKIPPHIREIMVIVKAAQLEAIRIVRAERKAFEVDQQARKYLRKFGLVKYFCHSLGHGVGLDVHEDPRISSQSNTKLQVGMVFTLEPAVYFPGQFGVRIEDMVLVTDKGCENLSS